MKAAGLALLFVQCTLFAKIESSAIPMWEYLSKDEKMSYLFSMFAVQVDEYCEFSELRNCHQELLKFGLKKLKGMPEDHLDTMDPYQRGANSIIWDSMMEGHETMSSKPRLSTTTTTTAKPNSYEDESFSSEGNYALQGEASAKIDNVYRLPPPRDFVYNSQPENNRNPIYTDTYGKSSYEISSGIPQYKYPEGAEYPQRQQTGFVYSNEGYSNEGSNTINRRQFEVSQPPLTGPMVVMVHPDGKPVQGHQQQLPHDEDLSQYRLVKTKIPDLY